MSNKKYTPGTHFVPVSPFVENIFQGGSVALPVGYFDHAGAIEDKTPQSKHTGRYIEYIGSRNKDGKDVPKRFRFDQSVGRLLTRPTDYDVYGKSQYAFLKNHPDCEGSPNGTYVDGIQTGITFREVDSVKDAKSALRFDKLITDAKASAYGLDTETLAEIGNLIGEYGDPDDLMRLKVVEFAGKRPNEYNEFLTSGDRGTRALVRKALAEKVFTNKGPLILWGEHVVGNTEDEAVSNVRADKDMLKALQEKLDIQVELATGGKKAKRIASL